MTEEPVHLSILDEISRRYDDIVNAWGVWRDAQDSDDTKALVDEVFATQCKALESIARSFGMDVLPF